MRRAAIAIGVICVAALLLVFGDPGPEERRVPWSYGFIADSSGGGHNAVIYYYPADRADAEQPWDLVRPKRARVDASVAGVVITLTTRDRAAKHQFPSAYNAGPICLLVRIPDRTRGDKLVDGFDGRVKLTRPRDIRGCKHIETDGS